MLTITGTGACDGIGGELFAHAANRAAAFGQLDLWRVDAELIIGLRIRLTP